MHWTHEDTILVLTFAGALVGSGAGLLGAAWLYDRCSRRWPRIFP